MAARQLLDRFLDPFRRHRWLDPALILGLALVVRLALNALILGFDYLPDPDHQVYESAAVNLMNGRGLVCAEGKSYTAPLYPIFLAGVYSLFGVQNAVAVKIVESLLGALTCGILFGIGGRLFDPISGRVAGWIAVFYPFLAYATAPELTENLFLFLLAAGVLCLAALFDGFRWRWALGAGLCLGLATLTRPVTLVMPLVLLVWAGLTFRSLPHAPRTALIVSLVMALVVAPWFARNYRVQGQVLFATEDGITFWGSNNPVVAANPEKAGRWMMYTELPHADELRGLPELELRQRANALGWQFLRENPGLIPYLAVQKMARFWSLYPNRGGLEKLLSLLSYGVLFPFMLLGAGWALLKNRPAALLLLGVISIFAAASLVYYGSTRMRLPAEPYLILFASYALAHLVQILVQTGAVNPALKKYSL